MLHCVAATKTRTPTTGRVWSKRASGQSLIFYDLRGDGAKIQVMADAKVDTYTCMDIIEWCVCECIYIYCIVYMIYMYICVYMYMCICIYVYVFVHINVYMHIYV